MTGEMKFFVATIAVITLQACAFQAHAEGGYTDEVKQSTNRHLLAGGIDRQLNKFPAECLALSGSEMGNCISFFSVNGSNCCDDPLWELRASTVTRTQ
jgi:hypothetical protein